MNKRWTLTALVLVIAAVLAVIFLIGRAKSPGGEESEAVADMAVHVGADPRATLHRFVTAYGTVEPEPAGTRPRSPADADVAAPVDGVVARVDCVEGQRVAKGAVLFHLDGRVAEHRPGKGPRRPWPSPKEISSGRKNSSPSRERPGRITWRPSSS